MKTTLGTLLIFLTLLTQAQPSLKSPYNLVPGYGYTYREITNSVNYQNIATTGANIVWDFTGIQLATTLRTDTILTLQQSLFPTSFPTASYVLQESNGLQQFYEVKQDTVFYLGNTFNNQPSVFDSGLPVFLLPIPFQAVLPDQFSQNTAPGYSAQWKASFRYEAYGTLNLPNGKSYNNVGLYVGKSGEANGGVSYINYSFFREDDRIPLLRIQLQQSGSALTVQTAFLTENFPSIGLEELKAKVILSVYPNPAQTEVHVQLDETVFAEVSLIDVSGKKLLELQPVSRYFTLDVSTFPKGIYYLEVKNKLGVYRQAMMLK